jgi:hypothetical protein
LIEAKEVLIAMLKRRRERIGELIADIEDIAEDTKIMDVAETIREKDADSDVKLIEPQHEGLFICQVDSEMEWKSLYAKPRNP